MELELVLSVEIYCKIGDHNSRPVLLTSGFNSQTLLYSLINEANHTYKLLEVLLPARQR